MQRRDLLKSASILLGASLSSATVNAMSMVSDPHQRPPVSKFSPSQYGQLTVLSQLIIPTTDSPGAIEARVPEFIDLIVSQWQTETERSVILNGLDKLNQHCLAQYNSHFIECETQQQEAALSDFELLAKQEIAKGSAEEENSKTFFYALRELVVVGFFTSHVGATQALKHVHVAGAYIGDYPTAKAGRAWSPIY
jgi:glucoside 3-dehydrogenase (cytochrome c) hitch-hiker subunit